MRERLEQGPDDRRLGAVEPSIDLAHHQHLRRLHERARERESRAIDRAEPRDGFDFAAAQSDALERTPGRETLRLARQPKEPMKRSVHRFAGHEDVPEQRAVLDRPSAHVDLSHDPSDPPDRVAGYRDVSEDRKSTRLNSSHLVISYAVFCLKKKK